MFGRCGDIDRAKAIFNTRSTRSTNASVNTMINAFGYNGLGTEAMGCFDNLHPSSRDAYIYTSILLACSHSGLFSEAHSIFNSIPINSRSPSIYAAMLDVLSCEGAFDQAQFLIDEYERSHPPYAYLYETLLIACQRHSLNSTDDNHNQNRIEQLQARLRTLAIDQTRVSGVAWTLHGHRIVEFQPHDMRHEKSPSIHALARQLDGFETSKDKHSSVAYPDRLALAFNLLHFSSLAHIRLTYSLRMSIESHVFFSRFTSVRDLIVTMDNNLKPILLMFPKSLLKSFANIDELPLSYRHLTKGRQFTILVRARRQHEPSAEFYCFQRNGSEAQLISSSVETYLLSQDIDPPVDCTPKEVTFRPEFPNQLKLRCLPFGADEPPSFVPVVTKSKSKKKRKRLVE